METIIQNFVHPFDLARAPLLRVGLVKTGGNNHILMLAQLPHFFYKILKKIAVFSLFKI
jgi:hypothetical protein